MFAVCQHWHHGYLQPPRGLVYGQLKLRAFGGILALLRREGAGAEAWMSSEICLRCKNIRLSLRGVYLST